MAQLVGRVCHICKRTIEVAPLALWCGKCGKPVHEDCLSPTDPSNDNLDRCPRCGVELRLHIPPAGSKMVANGEASPSPDSSDVSELRPASRTSARKTGRASGIVGVLFVLAIVGIFFYLNFGDSTSKVEKSVQQGMKDQFGIQVKSVKLEKQPDGTYKGKAIEENGEEWDILNVTLNGNEVKWIQRPPLAQVDRHVRQSMETQFKIRLNSLDLKKQADGNFQGTATSDLGIQYDVWEGFVPGIQETILLANPSRSNFELWIRHEAEAALQTKISSIQLNPQPNGNVHGTFLNAGGLKYDVRIGTPPGEVWNLNDPSIPRSISWQASISPDSYVDWARAGMEEQLKIRVQSIELKKQPDGIYRGTAESTTGAKYAVEVGELSEPEKPKLPEGQINLKEVLNQPDFQPKIDPNRLQPPQAAKYFRIKEGRWTDLGPDQINWRATKQP